MISKITTNPYLCNGHQLLLGFRASHRSWRRSARDIVRIVDDAVVSIAALQTRHITRHFTFDDLELHIWSFSGCRGGGSGRSDRVREHTFVGLCRHLLVLSLKYEILTSDFLEELTGLFAKFLEERRFISSFQASATHRLEAFAAKLVPIRDDDVDLAVLRHSPTKLTRIVQMMTVVQHDVGDGHQLSKVFKVIKVIKVITPRKLCVIDRLPEHQCEGDLLQRH